MINCDRFDARNEELGDCQLLQHGGDHTHIEQLWSSVSTLASRHPRVDWNSQQEMTRTTEATICTHSSMQSIACVYELLLLHATHMSLGWLCVCVVSLINAASHCTYARTHTNRPIDTAHERNRSYTLTIEVVSMGVFKHAFVETLMSHSCARAGQSYWTVLIISCFVCMQRVFFNYTPDYSQRCWK